MSYLRLAPPKDAVIPTRDVAPPQWPQPDARGVWPEGTGRFSILAFTRPEQVRDARTAATRQVQQAGKATEEVDNDIWVRELFNRCLKGWQHLIDPDTDQPILFTPENVERLPEDAKAFLVDQILAAGNGILATRDLITRDAETGAPLDYKSPAAQVQGGDAQG